MVNSTIPYIFFFFFSSRRRHTRLTCDWSSDVCSSDLTETGDAEGPVVSRAEVKVTRSELLAALERYRGEIEQLPPIYAAIKHRGRPLYAYARRGEHVPRAARRVAIRRLELEKFEVDTVGLFVECSKGTYIRALAEDIGADLGCGAHLAALERT